VKNSLGSNWPQGTPTLNIEWGQIDPKGNRRVKEGKWDIWSSVLLYFSDKTQTLFPPWAEGLKTSGSTLFTWLPLESLQGFPLLLVTGLTSTRPRGSPVGPRGHFVWLSLCCAPSVCPDVTGLPTHKPLLCIPLSLGLSRPLSFPPPPFVDSNSVWPSGRPGRGNRRVSAEEAARRLAAGFQSIHLHFGNKKQTLESICLLQIKKNNLNKRDVYICLILAVRLILNWSLLILCSLKRSLWAPPV